MNQFYFSFPPEREQITSNFNSFLNMKLYPVMGKLSEDIEKKLVNYPKVQELLKEYYLAPDFPEKYIIVNFDVFFNETLVYRWVFGVSETRKENLQDFTNLPELIRIDVSGELGLLMYKGEIIFNRISEIEIGSIISMCNDLYNNRTSSNT